MFLESNKDDTPPNAELTHGVLISVILPVARADKTVDVARHNVERKGKQPGSHILVKRRTLNTGTTSPGVAGAEPPAGRCWGRW